MGVLRVVLQMVLGIVLTLGLQLLLRAWATPEQRARGWNVATWGSALQWFGPLSMLGFCVVHGHLTALGVIRSLLRGLTWTALLALFASLVDVGFVGRWGTPRDRREIMESFGPLEARPATRGPARKARRARPTEPPHER